MLIKNVHPTLFRGCLYVGSTFDVSEGFKKGNVTIQNYTLFSHEKLTTLPPPCFESVVSFSTVKVYNFVFFLFNYLLSILLNLYVKWGGVVLGRGRVASAMVLWPLMFEFQSGVLWFPSVLLVVPAESLWCSLLDLSKVPSGPFLKFCRFNSNSSRIFRYHLKSASFEAFVSNTGGIYAS